MRSICVHSHLRGLAAAEELLGQSAEALKGDTPRAGILFSAYDQDHEALLRALTSAYPDLLLVGGASQGEVSTSLGYCTQSTVLMLLVSDGIDFVGGVVDGLHGLDSAGLKSAVAESINAQTFDQPPVFALLFPDGWIPTDGQAVVDAFAEALPDVPLFGGGVCDDFTFTGTRQFFRDRVYTEAVPYLLFCGPVEFSYGLTSNDEGGWKPYGPLMEGVAEGLEVLTLDGKPAMASMHSGFQLESGVFSLAHPIAVYEHESDSAFYYRDVVSANPESGTLQIVQVVPSPFFARLTEPQPNKVLLASS